MTTQPPRQPRTGKPRLGRMGAARAAREAAAELKRERAEAQRLRMRALFVELRLQQGFPEPPPPSETIWRCASWACGEWNVPSRQTCRHCGRQPVPY